MANEPQSNPQQSNPFQRDEDFLSLYANNVQLEPSIWDLKLIFGQLNQSGDKLEVEQHTAIAIPWIQAKLLTYFLELQVGAYEADYGPINVHRSVMPAPPDASQFEHQNGLAKALIDYFIHRYRWYFGEPAPQQATSQPDPNTKES